MMKSHWPKFVPEVYRVGVLKLVPKIHKLVGPITASTWIKMGMHYTRCSRSTPRSPENSFCQAQFKQAISIEIELS